MRDYPKLMCSKEAPDKFVVYFANPTSGMVVHSEDSAHPVGTLSLHWDSNLFMDVPDDYIIWLTEGPQEPILEAIRMIGMITRSSPESETV